MSLDQKFKEMETAVRGISKGPTDQEYLELYSLYKQAIIGNVNIPKPAVSDVKAKAKWDAWKTKEGMSQNDAKEAYVNVANKLIGKYK
ncbi:acyl-CoA-binding domain-containing protein 7-like [Xylocopa sonorina]|uniref:acyl-CoA-binding domain-containing protein 7-like n=1 Tax=Xylocopa sonorina TaxID=1818115 RepID=UPI00403A95C3